MNKLSLSKSVYQPELGPDEGLWNEEPMTIDGKPLFYVNGSGVLTMMYSREEARKDLYYDQKD